MKKVTLMIVTLLVSTFAMAENRKLDANSVELADALVKPEIRQCIDSALNSNNASGNGSFSVKGVETYTTEEPLSFGSVTTQQVTHYLLQTRALSKTANGSSKMIRIVFDIEIASGTGILSYSCSSQVQ